MKRARERMRELVLQQFEKRFDLYSGTFYYHSNKTGVDSFAKPRILRSDQVRRVIIPRSVFVFGTVFRIVNTEASRYPVLYFDSTL